MTNGSPSFATSTNEALVAQHETELHELRAQVLPISGAMRVLEELLEE